MNAEVTMPHVARVAVGSTNPLKVRAVQTIVCQIWPHVAVQGVEVDSGVGAMPMTDQAGAAGARQRARLAREVCDADLGIGLEGAVHTNAEGMILCNWAAVVDRQGFCSLAEGGRLPLPACFAHEIARGVELGQLIDRSSGEQNTKLHQGAAGFLTHDLVSREMAFRVAVAFALAPLINPALYQRQ